MTRCSEECGKQWRLVQGKLGWEKQKEEKAKKEAGKRREDAKKGNSKNWVRKDRYTRGDNSRSTVG